MDETPYKFSEKNPRLVTNMVKNYEKIYLATGAIFAFSMVWYNKKFFRCDKDIMNFTLFGIGSTLASYSWANFIFSSSEIEAALKNNEKEA